MMIVCFGISLSGCSNVPATNFVSEAPSTTGHVVEINYEEQVFAIIENISKQEALDYKGLKDSSDEVWIYINKSKIEDNIMIGDKVAIWKNSEVKEIANLVVVLEE